MRMLLLLLTAKAAPGGLFSNDALLIFNFNFRFLSTFIAWPTERERSNFRLSIQNFVKEKLLNIQLMRTNYVLQHFRVHADSEYYHVCGGGRPYNGDEFIGNKQIYLLTNKQTHKHSTLYITYPIMHSSRWHNLALAAVFPVSWAKPTGKVLLQTNGT